ncbi:MAG: RagB/SusD family nutrient uptake outer membrane protein [Odoribacteraceae bacterium]|jgi:hypothetical protein|nr:RagB/SusD family nutrient uptake outer membrane protein [Odoribacteraceae bacterium]
MKYRVILLILGGFLANSCNSWLDVTPDSERLAEQYWQKKEDVHNTVMSCYVRMRDCLPKIVEWGELRADVFEVRQETSLENQTKLQRQNITPDNTITQWAPFYKMINSANAVIQYASLVLDRDPLFTEMELNQYQAEAKVMRALAYFYLVRTFGEVPLILNPYVTDRQELIQPKVAEEEILAQLLIDLRWSLKRLKTSHGEKWQTKGRATRWLCHALMADIYLWSEQYADCIEACNAMIANEDLRLVASDFEDERYEDEVWYDIFYPGLSDESIFELYFDAENDQRNSLFSWFDYSSSSRRYSLVTSLADEFKENDQDVRGENRTYYTTGWMGLWKYLGMQVAGPSASGKRSTSVQSANWPVYRLAEAYLMRSEANLMLGNARQAAIDLNVIRQRAKVTTLREDVAEAMTQKELLMELLKERKMEFIGEGKRWYDIVRTAKKSNFALYKDDMVALLLNNIPVSERPIYLTRLSSNNSFFLPINKDEIDRCDGVLIQNPVYQ